MFIRLAHWNAVLDTECINFIVCLPYSLGEGLKLVLFGVFAHDLAWLSYYIIIVILKILLGVDANSRRTPSGGIHQILDINMGQYKSQRTLSEHVHRTLVCCRAPHRRYNPDPSMTGIDESRVYK